jgi:drug/metabolite transporter (DMT)-like permease
MTSSVQGAVAAPGRAAAGSRPGVWLTELALLGMVLIWGINYVVVKYATSQVAPLAFNGVRVGVAAVALLALAVATSRTPWPSRRDLAAVLALGALGNGVYQIFFIEGIARTGAGTAALILAASPAVVALIGRFLGVERVSSRAVWGIALSIVGVALVMLGGREGLGHTSRVGNLLMFAGCVAWAVFSVMLKPYADRVRGVQLTALAMTGGALLDLLVGLPAIAATRWGAVSLPAWGALTYGSLVALVAAYLMWNRGVRVLGPTHTAIFGNLQPFVALLAAWLVFGEVPTAVQLTGAVGITGGILLTRT